MDGSNGDGNGGKAGLNSDPPTEILCPNVKEHEIVAHMKEHYGLEVIKQNRQNGYDDYNVHVMVAGSHNNSNITTVADNGYFIKVSNINDSRQPEVLDAQLAAMRHLVTKGIPCQTAVKSVDGRDITDLKVHSREGEDRTHKVSVRTYLPGYILASATMTPDLLFKVGQFVAKVTKALGDFSHPFYATFDCLWNMSNMPKVGDVTHAVTEPHRRAVCDQVLQAFRDDVEPRKAKFRKGMIHGDLNEQNILVSSSGQPDISGLLDFQDCALSYPVYDLAIMAGYMMMIKSTDVPRPEMPGYVLAGFESELSLNDDEKAAFHTLAASRMVMSLAYGAYYFSLDPTNLYLLETSKAGWDALMEFWNIPKQTMEDTWWTTVKSLNQ